MTSSTCSAGRAATRFWPPPIRMIRAEQASQDFRRDRERWAAPVAISETELGFLGATASAYIQQQTKGHYPAPLAALEVMLGAAGVDVETACQMEAEEFAKLFGSPINRALLNVFFLTDRNKKATGAAADATPRKITSAGVVGAGRDGAGYRGRQRQTRTSPSRSWMPIRPHSPAAFKVC